VERKWIGGSCASIVFAEGSWIWNAKVADLVNHGTAFGIVTGTTVIDMRHVRQRKHEMVEGLITMHWDQYRASGAELIMGAARVAGTMASEAEERRTAPRQINSDMA
jgi:hypothetical protein